MAPRRVSATATSIEIIEAVDERESAGVTEIADAIGGSKANVHKHLKTLQDAGFVREREGEYQLAHRFLSFAMAAKRREPVYREGVTTMEKLADFTGTTTVLVVREGCQALYLHTVAPAGEERAEALEGTRAPLHEMAGGLAVLSAYPEGTRRDLLEQSTGSASRVPSLLDRLDAVGDGEAVVHPPDAREGPEEIAAPIVGDDGDPAGAIGLRYPTTSGGTGRVETDLRKLVRDAASTVSKRLAITGGE